MASGKTANTKRSNNSDKKTGSGVKKGKSGSASASSRKKSTNSKSGGTRKSMPDNQLANDISILVGIAIVLILLLSNFNLCGSVGKGIKWFTFGLIGVTEYIVPFLILFGIIFSLANRDLLRILRIKYIAVAVLTVLSSALIQRIYNKPEIDSRIEDFFTYSANHYSGGGLFGGFIAKLLNPLGLLGSLVIIIILMIVCIVVITEKSLINGLNHVKDSGKRMMDEAKEDYSAYMEHSSRKRDEESESEEEYHERREKERDAARMRRIEKQQKALDEKRLREERIANSRANRKVRGVTLDTLITPSETNQDIDIHEIIVDEDINDKYTKDIYDPGSNDVVSEIPFDDYFFRDSDDRNVAQEHKDNKTSMGTCEEHEINEVQDSFKVNSKSTVVSGNNEAFETHETKETSFVPEAVNSDATGEETAVMDKNASKHVKNYVFPPIDLLNKNRSSKSVSLQRENKETALRLQQTLQNFGVKVTITDICCGPTVTRYELQPEQGVKVSKIVSLSDDIKLSLAAADIRIEAPIPGKAAIGIEVPNKESGSVVLRDLLESDEFKNAKSIISFGAGKDIAGKTIVADIAKMPHLLIAGATGSGKSVCINTIIMSILYKARPDEVKMIMIDPKVVELSVYNGIPHLLLPVVSDPKKAAGALQWAVKEMTDRYQKFADFNVRNLAGYNEVADKKNANLQSGELPVEKMPQIVIIIDELADLMMVASGEVEDSICRLAQLARAAGIHMVIATQRPTVNVITGLIKANVPSRIAFSVSSGLDSRTILDMNGAEKLLGKGDMLYFPSNIPKPIRVQGAFVSDQEVSAVVDFLKANAGEVNYDENIATSVVKASETGAAPEKKDDRDSLFVEAGRFVIESKKGSIGSLQRHFKVGFNRAGRIMDQLMEAGVVGQEFGTKPREVLMTIEQFEAIVGKGSSEI
ncbi:MAG: DNA translocase FtsK [Lachnospira sp.]